MPKFYVSESATVDFLYVVEAETEDDARDRVEEGFEDPLRTDYIDREVFDIRETEDAK